MFMLALLSGCQATPGSVSSSFGTESMGDTSEDGTATGLSDGTEATSATSAATVSDTSTDDGPDTAPLLDVQPPQDGCLPPEDDGLQRPAPCTSQAPPDSFDAQVQWSWWGDEDAGRTSVWATPLVANLTDDNGDGNIDLCDVPDIVLNVFDQGELATGILELTELESPWWVELPSNGTLWILDGATGLPHLAIDDDVNPLSNPALGDLDGDGVPEIVVARTPKGPLAAYRHDGSPVDGFDGTTGDVPAHLMPEDVFNGAIALADLDHDGDPEIVIGNLVFDHMGTILHVLPDHVVSASGSMGVSATIVADLNEDGRPEVILPRSAFTFNGDGSISEYYRAPESLGAGYPHVADFDGDGHPEVLITTGDGINLLDHEGNVLLQGVRPFEVTPCFGVIWTRPGSVHDFFEDEGPSVPEFAFSAGDQYVVNRVLRDESGVWSIEAAMQWTVDDCTGAATGTAFDFLGDGSPEAIYNDEYELWVFDTSAADATPFVQWPRTHATLIEYPVVADVDNDGSAEIVVVSNTVLTIEGDVVADESAETPTVQVVRDAEDRWIGTRRIWNQHTYHVTNVREDGTIPAHMVPSWSHLNTFRTNLQTEEGAVCTPAG